MPIDVYSGTPGSGKSLSATKLILQRMLFGLRTITNFEVIPPKSLVNCRQPIIWDNSQMTIRNFINFSRKFHYRNIKGGYPEHQTLVIIDEAQLLFDKDFLTPRTRRQWKYFFTQHRKLGFDFLLITQHISMLDTSIRYLLERETSHFKFDNAPSTNFLMLLFYWICRGLGVTLFFAVTGWVHNDKKMFRSRKFFQYRAWLRFSRFIDVFERDGCQVRSHVRNESVILDRINGVEAGGTFYVGNYHHSEQFLRIYNKAHQMYSPVDLNYDKSWVRVEHVMKRNYANAAIEAILNSGLDDFGEVCAEILNGFMTIVDESDFNISRCKVVQWWSEALETLIAVKLWEPGQIVHTVTKKMQYLRDFLAPTFAMICSALGSDYNFNYFINRLVRDGTYRMSERQRSLAQSYRMSSSGLPI